jgi:hypothetical protein
MARQDALSIKLQDGTTAAQLAEVYGYVIENVEGRAVSVALKNFNLSGDPMAGSVEAKRFENAVSVAYGTARTAGAGVDVKTLPVIINLNVDREIVEEIEAKDIALMGISAIMQRRVPNHISAMIRELDTAFFTKGYVQGAALTTSGSTTAAKLEELIVKLETVSNDFVDGTNRDMLALVVTPAIHSALRLEIDAFPATDNAYAKGSVGLFHGVEVYVSNHLPKASGQVVSAFCMMKGSIAQPVAIAQPYTDERIPLSNAHAVELFYNYGTEAVMPDLIFYIGDAYSA